MAFVIFFSACSGSHTPLATSTSAVVIATQTFTPQFVPTQTLTSSPIPVVPTLPFDEALERFWDLLADNDNCRLPCLWGITPGKSTYQEAQAVFVPISSLSDLTGFIPEGGAIFPKYTDGDLNFVTDAEFTVGLASNNQLVNKVSFQARELKRLDNKAIEVFDLPSFKQRLAYYMLPNILTEYGSPAMVMIATMAKLPSTGVAGGFKALLLYPDQGILINYTMQMQIAGENIRGCPSNAHVELDLYPSGQGNSFFDWLGPSGWTQTLKTYKLIDDATSLTQEDFYQTFKQQTDQCILTPANIWPVPD